MSFEINDPTILYLPFYAQDVKINKLIITISIGLQKVEGSEDLFTDKPTVLAYVVETEHGQLYKMALAVEQYGSSNTSDLQVQDINYEHPLIQALFNNVKPHLDYVREISSSELQQLTNKVLEHLHFPPHLFLTGMKERDTFFFRFSNFGWGGLGVIDLLDVGPLPTSEEFNHWFKKLRELAVSQEDIWLPANVIHFLLSSEQSDDVSQLELGIGEADAWAFLGAVDVDELRTAVDIAKTYAGALSERLGPLIVAIHQALIDEFEAFSYLGPLRSYPARLSSGGQEQDPTWKAGGGMAWQIVRRNPDIREKVNTWLGADFLKTQYRLEERNLHTIEEIVLLSNDISPLINTGLPVASLPRLEVEPLPKNPSELDLKKYELGLKSVHHSFAQLQSALLSAKSKLLNAQDKVLKSLIHTMKNPAATEFSLIDLRSNIRVSHRDVGIGISQVLPVLVNSYSAQRTALMTLQISIVAIEQPEIHLHPALQAELGDVFIESALGSVEKNLFILETHSEHLILRIMRRMRETANGELPEGVPEVRPEDVTVLYVEPMGDSSVVRVLELDEEGNLLDPWPGGFFEEGFNERFA